MGMTGFDAPPVEPPVMELVYIAKEVMGQTPKDIPLSLRYGATVLRYAAYQVPSGTLLTAAAPLTHEEFQSAVVAAVAGNVGALPWARIFALILALLNGLVPKPTGG